MSDSKMSSEETKKKLRVRPRRYLRPVKVHKHGDDDSDDKNAKDKKKQEKRDVIWGHKDWTEALESMEYSRRQTKNNNDLMMVDFLEWVQVMGYRCAILG